MLYFIVISVSKSKTQLFLIIWKYLKNIQNIRKPKSKIRKGSSKSFMGETLGVKILSDT